MTKFLKVQFLKYCFFILLIAITHYLLLLKALPEIYLQSAPWRIYLFLVPIELLGLWFIYLRFKKDQQSVIKNFLFFMVVKMISALLFLSPWIFYKDEFTLPFVYQFFAIFFPLLFSELGFLVKMLNFVPAENEKNEKIQE